MGTLTIITGASRGLGLALARACIEPGATLVTLERHPNAALPALAKQLGAECVQLPTDMADMNSTLGIFNWWLSQQNEEAYSSARLICNAAILGHVGPIENASALDLIEAFKVNFETPALLIQAFLKHTATWRIDRRVMAISSGAGRRSVPGWTLYCSTKAALDRFCATVAADEARLASGAKICAIAPGVVDTDMQAQVRSSNPQDFPQLERFINLHQAHQLASAEQTALSLLEYFNSTGFGSEPIADIRDIH